MMTLTRTEESTAVATAIVPTLLLAFELGETHVDTRVHDRARAAAPHSPDPSPGDGSAGGGTRAREGPVQVAGRCAGHELL
jgi:hypothetical protein